MNLTYEINAMLAKELTAADPVPPITTVQGAATQAFTLLPPARPSGAAQVATVNRQGLRQCHSSA